MSSNREVRIFESEQLELRQESDGESLLEGYAAVFGRMSADLGGWTEKIKRGAFRDSLKRGDDVVALFNHDPNQILGRRSVGTLTVKEDRDGLRTQIKLPDTTVGRDLAVAVERGDVSKMSFGFFTISDKWTRVDGGDVRELVAVDLLDVSPVTFAAYPDTSVGLRSLETWRTGPRPLTPEEIADVERRMRLSGAT